MKIAILALQGAFIEHKKMLSTLGVSSIELRQSSDLDKSFDGIILPGGESTTQGKLLKELDMFCKLKSMIENKMPIFGTCAGLILLSNKIDNQENAHLQTMNILTKRNAFGRQLGSFYCEGNFNDKKIPMTFIRAPYIKEVSNNVKVLSICKDKIVAARENNQLVTAFHPELNDDTYVHEYFLNMIKN